MKIVATEFELWEHGTENPTLEILDQLESSNDLEGELTTMRLLVDRTKLDALLTRYWNGCGQTCGSASACRLDDR